jgi:hypothetical protein
VCDPPSSIQTRSPNEILFLYITYFMFM